MQHGDIQLRVSLGGEPQKLVTYWRGSLRGYLPTRALVTILRPRPKSQQFHWWHDPNFHFEAITRTEKKRAELSVSEKSLMMLPNEIAIARDLTERLSNWLSQRQGIPSIDQPIPNARIRLQGDGGPELVSVIESFPDPGVLSAAEVGVVYTQGEPRRPGVRWLPPLNGADESLAVSQLQSFAKSLADGQEARVRALIDRIVGVFRKQIAIRRAAINKRAAEIFGCGTTLTIEGELITDRKIEEDYWDILAWLDEQAKERAPKDKIRTWRRR
jgi:hypothetical protein